MSEDCPTCQDSGEKSFVAQLGNLTAPKTPFSAEILAERAAANAKEHSGCPSHA